jgi:ArsR family transcriptional regulator, arsenate/arsenite/antimonite-responsive transcriptional repressor
MTQSTAIELPQIPCCPPLATDGIDDEQAAALATVFKALADPHRVRIVNLLTNRGDAVCVCDITAAVGLAQPTVSHHLKKLTAAGLLEREQRGVWAYYSVNTDTLQSLSDAVDPIRTR